MKRLVVSAVNLIEGGTLTVLIESLDAAAKFLDEEWEIIALVHDAGLIKNPRVRSIAFPQSKRSWGTRLLLEWYRFEALSKQLQPDLWLSLHDITPRVQTRRQVVYCHNPAPFYSITWREAVLEPKFLLFNLFYKYLYRVNIHRNYAVVVQQEWLRSAFYRLYRHPNIIVAHPVQQKLSHPPVPKSQPGKKVFLYPALPRVFKNIEVLCEAAAILPEEVQDNIEIRLTVDGTENRYARNLVRRFGGVKALRFIGRQSRDDMAAHYAQCDAVLFPSKLETWGLPITEAKTLGKPLLVADLPYAHETVGTYALVTFLPPNDPAVWSQALAAVAAGKWVHFGNVETTPGSPYATDWPQLWALLTEGL
jgi:glycosyltransferase involved in cell wall biosynthesis